MRNSNDRSDERDRQATASAAAAATASADKDSRAAAAQIIDSFTARVDKISERARVDVQAQLKAAGADRSPLAEVAEQRIDAMRKDQTARVREAVDATRDPGKNTQAVEALMKKAIDESVQMREELGKEISSYRDRRADASVDKERVAELQDRVQAAQGRNDKRKTAIEDVRDEVRKEMAAPGMDADKREALQRDAAELDRRIATYRERAEAIESTNKLLEQGRVDLAERYLEFVKLADGGRRAKQDRAADEARVDKLHQADEAGRTAIKAASQFAVLDRKFSDLEPIRKLWNQAAQTAKDAREKQKGPDLMKEMTIKEARDLYNAAMDQFKKLLTDAKDQTARDARALFEKDEFRFAVQRGELERKLPMLNDPRVESQIDMGRHADLLRISGQHLTKIEQGGDPVAADNLSFMIARDNMQMDVKGALSEYVREKVVKRLKEEELEEDEEA